MKKGWSQKEKNILTWIRNQAEKVGHFFRHSSQSVRRVIGHWLSRISWPKKVPTVQLDEKRRAFLKYALFGGGLFLVGKYMNPLINTLQGDAVVDEKVFRNFTLTETGKQLQVTDDDGNEILTIDKESF